MLFFNRSFDERFILHRLKSTRFAALVTVLAMAAYFLYEFYTTNTFRYDIFVFMLTMAIGKVCAMLYYKLRH